MARLSGPQAAAGDPARPRRRANPATGRWGTSAATAPSGAPRLVVAASASGALPRPRARRRPAPHPRRAPTPRSTDDRRWLIPACDGPPPLILDQGGRRRTERGSAVPSTGRWRRILRRLPGSARARAVLRPPTALEHDRRPVRPRPRRGRQSAPGAPRRTRAAARPPLGIGPGAPLRPRAARRRGGLHRRGAGGRPGRSRARAPAQ